MKQILILVILCFSLLSFSQEKDIALQASNDFVSEGNDLISNNEFVSAEMEYRKALSKKSNNAIASYDLGNAYYKNEQFEEALLRHTEAVQYAKTKEQKHKAWHNIGNTLMKGEKCQEAVEAYKNALRNNPSDDETRYNFGLAKECAKKQQQEEENKKDDKKEEEEDKDKEEDKKKEDEKKDDKEKEEKDKDNGDDKKDEKGDPKDEKEEQNKEGEQDNRKQKPQQQPGKLSPQQIKNLLEAMNNQEQKVQEKINAKKTKGLKVRTDKDW